MILEYKLHKTEKGMRTPEWISDGGYWNDPDNHTYIGWTPDENSREYYVPDTVTELTVEELKARVLDLHSRYPEVDPEENTLSNADMEARVETWLNNFS